MSLSGFTPRELEILQLVILGQTNKAIARDTHISEKAEILRSNTIAKGGAYTHEDQLGFCSSALYKHAP